MNDHNFSEIPEEMQGETPQEAAQRLAALDAVSYDRSREAEAKALGIRVKTLDELVANLRGASSEPAHGRRVTVKLPEPWPDAVRLADILDELAHAIERHVVIAPAARDGVALWAAHTWVFERFQQTPRLLIQSPEKRCGKSTLLEILRLVCRNPVKADSVSAASVFRVVEALRPLTLLIDEADAFLKDNEELRGVINSGFEQSGNVLRVVEMQGEHVPVQFCTFAPTAISGIGRLPETITDRGLPARLERKTAAQKVAKLREGGRERLLEIARKLHCWANNNASKLKAAPAIPDNLNDRQGDISVPLLSIADAAGGEWPSRARKALLTLFRDRADTGEDEGTGAMLLADIWEVFRASSGALQLPSATLAERLGAMEDRPWSEWRQGRPITAPQLARALKPFRIWPNNMRTAGGSGVAKGYRRDQFEEAWGRYCENPSTPPFQTATPLHAAENQEKSGTQSATVTNHVAERISLKPAENKACSGVADRNPPLDAPAHNERKNGTSGGWL